MKKKAYSLSILLLAAISYVAAQESYSNLEFVQNKGQWNKEVLFKAEMNAGAFFLRQAGFTVLLYSPGDLRALTTHAHGATPGIAQDKTPGAGGPPAGGLPSSGAGEGDTVHSHAYRVIFLGANENALVTPDKALATYENYFIGNDPSKWAGHCNMYQGVVFHDVYPNIDIRYYSEKGRLKFDLIVRPGGDPGQIIMKYEGVDKLSTRNNQLVIGTSVGDVRELAPYSFQAGIDGRQQVSCKYIVSGGNTVKFKLGKYSTDTTLVIDPVLVFSSFTGSKISNWGFTATYGPDGSFFAGGIVFGNGYPVSIGAFETGFRGGFFDVGILKFSANGTQRVYATYLGGDQNETPHSLVCDPGGNLVILGRTYSHGSANSAGNFPYITRISDDYNVQTADMFVCKLNVDGSKLIGSMLIGGKGNDCVNIEDQVKDSHEKANLLIRNYGDDSRSEVILDGSNNIYIAASTQSPDFPVTPGVFQPVFAGGIQDGVVLKINAACNAIVFASFLGGTKEDAAFVLKLNPANNDIYVAGATNSTDFPGDKTNVLQPVNGGGVCDGFLTIISSDGTTQKKMTYLGTTEADAIYGVQLDKQGFPYVMGTTNGRWTRTANAAYYNDGGKQFVGKLQQDLSGYVYCTTFGSGGGAPGKPNISPVAFLVDRCENVYISGWGGWISSQGDPYGLAGTTGMPVTPDAIKSGTDNRDFYFIVLKKNASALLYGTFFGQTDNAQSLSEHVDGGTSRYDQNGIIYQGICANCGGRATTRFPTTPGVWGPVNGTGSDGCNEAAVKISFNYAGVSAGLRTGVNGRVYDTSGCIALTAVFQDTVRTAKSYIWSFGDGTPDLVTTGYEQTHVYPNVGFYTVRLIAIDSNSCNISDTAYTHVIGRSDKAPLDFDYGKIGACTSLNYQFANLSTAPPGKPFGNSSFLWDFGDGNQAPSGPADVTHNFLSAGTYIVKLILTDTSYCNYPDTAIKTLRISPVVRAQFVTPATGCAPYTAVFNNTSLGGQQFFWDFGDGNTSTSTGNPTNLYASPGTYTIHLTAIDSSTCNIKADTSITITVYGIPHAEFTFSPSPPVANTRTAFYNGSTGGVNNIWLFGDGTSEMKETNDTVLHQYEKTDTFQACLVVINQYGCPDTVCHPVATLINPLLDVPNAFTPGRFGQNGVISVVGFGITRMVFRIYNRWGQLVFESNDPAVGWDGTYKGVLQPMDVYAYTLEADFYNGSHATKRGDITLIR
ncbi:MAG: PKD domain-containing protein [Puia sp.]|nr:PKD domain-containing protein [Puia sp.]